MRLFISLLLVALLECSLPTIARDVNIQVGAHWPQHSTSYILELSEFLSEQSPESFWEYVENMCLSSDKIDDVITYSSSSGLSTEIIVGDQNERGDRLRQLEALAYSTAKDIALPAMRPLMDTMVKMGFYSPSIQFFQSLSSPFGNPCADSSSTGGAFAVIYPSEQIICENTDEKTFKTALDQAINTNNINENKSENMSENGDSEIGKKDIADSDPGSAKWDHNYTPKTKSQYSGRGGNQNDIEKEVGKEVESDGVKVVLYGVLGSSSFCHLHSFLEMKASERYVRYAARHAYPGVTPGGDTTKLYGYGVFLDIKNMEYKNEETDTGAKEDEKEDREEEKDSKSSKDKKDNKDDEEVTGSEVKEVKRVRDLGLQALSSIINAKDSVARFSEVVTNFPSMAPMLSRKRVTTALRKEVMSWYQSGVPQMLPGNAVFINGVKIDLSGFTFNVFGLLSEVRSEVVKMDKLSTLGLGREVREGLIDVAGKLGSDKSESNSDYSNPSDQGGLSMGGSIVRIDVSKGGKHTVTFLNNLEKDSMYRSWPQTMRQLLYPAWSIQTIARNMYTVIVVVNPNTYEGSLLLMQMNMMHQQQYPIRFGVVLDCEDTQELKKNEMYVQDGNVQDPYSTSTDICRLFATARENYGNLAAINFLFSVGSQISENAQSMQGPSISKYILLEMYTEISLEYSVQNKKHASAMTSITARNQLKTEIETHAMEILTAEKHGNERSATSVADEFIANSTLYLKARGLPSNSYSMNGIVKHEVDISGSIMQLMGREQYLLTNHYKAKKITDKTKSIFAAVLTDGGAYPRYHPLLQEQNIKYADFNIIEGEKLLQSAIFYNSEDKNSLPVSAEVDTDGTTTATTIPSTENVRTDTTMVFVPSSQSGYQSAAAAAKWALEASAGSSERISIDIVASYDYSDDDKKKVFENIENQIVIEQISFVSLLQDIMRGKSVVTNRDALSTLFTTFSLFGEGRSVEDVITSILKPSDDNGNKLLSLTEQDIVDLKKYRDTEVQASSASDSMDIGKLARTVMGVPYLPAKEVVVLRGSRVLVSDVSEGHQPLHELDLVLLASVEKTRIGLGVENVLSLSDREYSSDELLKITSFCGLYGSSGRHRYNVKATLEEAGIVTESTGGADSMKKSSLVFDPAPDTSNSDLESKSDSGISVYIIVDPLTLAGQRAASLVPLFRDHLKISVILLLIPVPVLSDFPLQNFYRSVLLPQKDSTTDLSLSLAHFSNLPRQHVLTVRMDVPEPWNVQATDAVQDIDNLRCDSKQCGDPLGSRDPHSAVDLTQVSYTLKSMLVAGQCFTSVPGGDSRRHSLPPNGLQLTLNLATHQSNLTSPSKKKASDTLVMQNLGYYQLQAMDPGLWILDLAAGRASSLFTLDGAVSEIGMFMAVRSFADVVNRISVTKRPGMEEVSLLVEDDEEEEKQDRQMGGLWSQFSSMIGGNALGVKEKKEKDQNAVIKVDDEDNKIHVFSLATGHLYERLLRIMMLSVTKRTSVPVKFWLLENFLSPTFKTIAAAMAQEYGFEVAYVTYTWPEWLTQQTQKQRIIWGYKILFLDVLFPLNVKKVIYVDADQVLRADLKELWDTDLEGKPYAYTPFCTSREETLGFQFWRQGYWAEHLRGKPYHISAIYVVDLKKFRQNAVGDQLRAVYDQLARDPNSLANLDQDLPNYAQHVVPIHSLPKEWLWCETWCSDDSKAEAKTIDLCNNPLHKESKLDMAKRVISGSLFNESWVQLDEEVKALEKRRGFGILINE